MSLGRYVVRKPGALFFLPNDHELYKAAYYKGGSTDAGYWNYATESDTPPTAEIPPGTGNINGAANYYDGGYIDSLYYTTPVGAYDSASAYGAFDLNGNVYEWNEFDYFGDWNGYHSRGIQGGSFANSYEAMNARARPYDDPEEGGRHTLGFRIACVTPIVPEPITITDILAFFEESLSNGTLVGSGPGKSSTGRLRAVRNMLEESVDLIEEGYVEDAYFQLEQAYKRCDGDTPPPDFVDGEAREELAAMIAALIADLLGLM